LQRVSAFQNDDGNSAPVAVLVLLHNLNTLAQCKDYCGLRGFYSSRLSSFGAVNPVKTNFYRAVQNQRVSIDNSHHYCSH